MEKPKTKVTILDGILTLILMGVVAYGLFSPTAVILKIFAFIVLFVVLLCAL